MDTSKIIKGVVSNGRYTVTAPIVKEDYGLYLQIEGVELPSTYEVDFSNSENNGTSVTMIGNADGVLIPRQFIDSGKDVFAFLYHVGANYGRTVYKFRIPNKARPDRTNEEPTPEEQSTIDQAISALNTAVEQTAQDKADADASAQSASADAERAEEAKVDAQNFATQAEEHSHDAESSSISASASARASAQSASQSAQIKTDVEGMVDDAQASASASAQSATASANSASQASASATSASQSATSAQGYASQAQSSAQTASANAQDASTSAQTASTKATESAQSASQALGYKTDAESAKTASQTAQGLAESARDSAISAKNDAEQAKADAITAKEEAESAVASISGALNDKAPVITDTASGAIASFTDGADDLPLKSLVVDINPVQDLSHGDPSPENLCPISGWTGMNVEACGKNLFDKNRVVLGGFIGLNGVITSHGSAGYEFVYVKGLASVTMSGGKDWSAARNSFFDSNKNFIGGTSTKGNKTIVVPDGAVWLGVSVNQAKNPTLDTSDLNTLQVESGSTATAYEPYQGQSISINWQTEAGTVYGGKLDVLSGKAVIDRAMLDMSTASWTLRDDTHRALTLDIQNLIKIPSSQILTSGSIAENYTEIRASASLTIGTYAIMQTGAVILYYDGVNAPSGKLVYPLATPIEIQLTPHEVNSLLGTNNIFADTGDTACEYRADTKLYIERLTAPDSVDMIADANIVSGQYFMVGNTLYKATANIANGGQITVGTNCTRVSLAQALNEINA